MTRSPRSTPTITPDATAGEVGAAPPPRVHDRRSLLGKLALGGASAAVGAAVLTSTDVRAALVGQATPPTGTTFFPVNPARAYDSRQPNYAEGGLLAPNTNRVVSVADGHNSSGTVTTADVVPEGAVAVQINLTAAEMTGGNYLAATAGDVDSTETSVVNWSDGATQVANAITVPIDADRQVRVYCGDQTGSTHVIVDVFGYYLPTADDPAPPASTTTTTVAPG